MPTKPDAEPLVSVRNLKTYYSICGSFGDRLVGLVDLDLGAAQRAAEAAGLADVYLATGLADLLGRVEADAVINVTIPEAHAEVTITALLNGLAVLCEKPVADTMSAFAPLLIAAWMAGICEAGVAAVPLVSVPVSPSVSSAEIAPPAVAVSGVPSSSA